MHQVKKEKKVKLRMIFMVATLLLCTSLVVTLFIQGESSFSQFYASLSVCFLQKYTKQIELRYYKRLSFAIASSLLLIVQIIIVFCSQFRHKDISSSNKIAERIIFVLISCTMQLLIPIALFYDSLLYDKLRLQMEVYWGELLMAMQSTSELITAAVCWGFSLSMSLEQTIKTEQQNSQLNQEQSKRIENECLGMENPLNEQLVKRQTVQQEGLKEENQNPLQFKDPFINLDQKPPTTPLKGSFDPNQLRIKTFYDDTDSQKYKKQKEQKIQKKNEATKLQKEKLKAQIQKRKKKFRQMSPNKIENRIEQQESEQTQIEVKMQNLPKRYRQYIREARKPKRIIEKSTQIFSVLKSAIQLNFPFQASQNEEKKLRKKPTENKNAQQELLCEINLKGKGQKRKRLFQQFGQCDDTQQTKKLPKRAPTKQESLMARLRSRYKFDHEETQ